MTEQWVPIANFRGYEVSNLGRVRSYLTSLGAQAALRRIPHFVRPSHDKQGCAFVVLCGRFGRVKRKVAMLVADAFGEVAP